MQESPSDTAPGCVVRVRGAVWTITRVTPGVRCRAVTLRPAAWSSGPECTLVEPFDRCVPVRRASSLRHASRRAWMARLRHALASRLRMDHPNAAARARVHLLPYQLEPVLTILHGLATRVLLADEVGLGKTVQAGLVVSELAARGEGNRTLVVVPAGLREQWRAELVGRFDLAPAVCDADWLAARVAVLPPQANPWLLPGIHIVSIDFLKQVEVLNALEEVVWDLLVVDEAHVATRGTDRWAAVDALARRARHVILATATPHDGEPHRFEALCDIGRLGSDDRIALFRRTRAAVGHATPRRVRTLPVRLAPEEVRMHELLSRYLGAVHERLSASADVRLALAVMAKRALSSARALELTALRRRALLAQRTDDEAEQVGLPFAEALRVPEGEDEGIPSHVLGTPGLPSVRHELAWLGAIAEAARRAGRRERKLLALWRALRRSREPVLVFTEYRDTLARVARELVGRVSTELLHGGQTTEERRRSLEAFTAGRARVLLATDAASEGLNLHQRCRWVVTLDLPWNPNRLEQRVGRVDRLGQQRTVHVLHLGLHDPADHRLRERLGARAQVIRRTLEAISICHVDRASDHGLPSARPSATEAGMGGLHEHTVFMPSFHDEPHSAARELLDLRGMLGDRGGRAGPVHEPGDDTIRRGNIPPVGLPPEVEDPRPPLVTVLRLPHGTVPGDWLLVYGVELVGRGRILERHVVPLAACREALSRADLVRHPRSSLQTLLVRHGYALAKYASESLGTRRALLTTMTRGRARRLLARGAAIDQDRRRRLLERLIQPGLFDVEAGPVSQPVPSVGAPASRDEEHGIEVRVTLFQGASVLQRQGRR